MALPSVFTGREAGYPLSCSRLTATGLPFTDYRSQHISMGGGSSSSVAVHFRLITLIHHLHEMMNRHTPPDGFRTRHRAPADRNPDHQATRTDANEGERFCGSGYSRAVELG